MGANPTGDWRDFYWYHRVDLGNGVVAEGDYDMRPYLPHYHFPDDMSGLRVLDVGRGSGFFSFEFEDRGANVTATELASFFDWDFVGGEAERRRRIASVPDLDAYTEKHITGAFHFAHAARRSKVRMVTANIYDLAPDTIPGAPFDLVFCGSVFSHLRDPIRALASLRSVTAPDGLCIIAAPALDGRRNKHRRFSRLFRSKKERPQLPLMAMLSGDEDRRSWWIMNKQCLVDGLRAVGFARVEIVSEFDLELKSTRAVCPHIVANARP